jgi:hypothetical protein
LVERWNAERSPLWSPTIRCAVTAGTPWLDVYCPGCRTSRAIDIRTPPPARERRQSYARLAMFVLPRLGTDASAQWVARVAAGREVERDELTRKPPPPPPTSWDSDAGTPSDTAARCNSMATAGVN